MDLIVFEHVGKTYHKTPVVKDLNLRIREGERLVLLGPSGCGKSTTLRMIAGLESITTGSLYMNGAIVNNVPSGFRNVSMVFQNYALYPHMTVEKNITYALRVHRIPKDEIKKRLDETLDILNLREYADRKPRELSGGQRQRAALARALVSRSKYLLLDEPLSNLDALLRVHARKELVKIHEIYGQTFIYVTHDQVEAMTMGNRIAVMNEGVLQMADSPERVYNRPANVFTAKFIGSPPANIIACTYEQGALIIGGQRCELPEIWRETIGRRRAELFLGIRPEHICLKVGPEKGALNCAIKYSENYGNKFGVFFDLEGSECVGLSDGFRPREGERVSFLPDFRKIHLFWKDSQRSVGYPAKFDTAESGPCSPPRPVNMRVVKS